VYTFDVTPAAQGAVTVNVAAGVAQDAILNNNIAAAQFSITYDTTVLPANQDQSEYMIGSVTVAVIFPESNGNFDSNTENWSKSRMDTCINEITAGLNWWKSLEPEAHLNFTIQNYYDKPTSYEPIKRPSTDQNLWINEILTGMGYTSGSYTQKVKDFNSYIRNYYETDWVFTIFVVDSLNDSNGEFTDGYFGYSYPGGPFIVMTHDNDSYGIDNMDAVTAHETGHIFYASDEYNNEAEYSGYLNVLDDDNATSCIMHGGINWNICTATRGQIGWKDSDSDGILDPVDTFPDTTLNSYSTNITSNAISITCTGTALDIPLANNNPLGPKNNVTINTIKTVQYRIDNGPWLNVSSADSAFDATTEAFSFTTTLLSTGAHTIEARAQNSVGNWEITYAQKTITINPVTIITSGLVPSIPVTIRYTEDGQLKTATTDGTWIGNPDINSTLTIDRIIEVSPTERYSASDTSWRVTGADTYTVNYYHQWKPVITITIENLNIRPMIYFVEGKETRQSRSRITLDGQLEWSEWVDTDSILNIESSVKKSWNNEWSSEDKNSWTVNSAITATVNYTRNYNTIYMASGGIIGAVILMGFGISLIVRQSSKRIKEK
ncbi:MAG: hypothetical protein NTV30_09220, partial [Chloroflexi bacterium]|nr:hypothetical protein [Chloroflexota bacterium]